MLNDIHQDFHPAEVGPTDDGDDIFKLRPGTGGSQMHPKPSVAIQGGIIGAGQCGQVIHFRLDLELGTSRDRRFEIVSDNSQLQKGWRGIVAGAGDQGRSPNSPKRC